MYSVCIFIVINDNTNKKLKIYDLEYLENRDVSRSCFVSYKISSWNNLKILLSSPLYSPDDCISDNHRKHVRKISPQMIFNCYVLFIEFSIRNYSSFTSFIFCINPHLYNVYTFQINGRDMFILPFSRIMWGRGQRREARSINLQL